MKSPSVMVFVGVAEIMRHTHAPVPFIMLFEKLKIYAMTESMINNNSLEICDRKFRIQLKRFPCVLMVRLI